MAESRMKRKGNKDMHTFNVSFEEEKFEKEEEKKLDPEDSDETEI